jgi:GT2 family glycosyltransferase
MTDDSQSAPAQSRDRRRFSVVVTTFDDPWSLSCVLRALACQTLVPSEVVVADDGSAQASSDALDRIAAELPFPLLHVRQPHDGFRAARSRNNGIWATTCPNLAFLDQDTVPHPDWLAAHASALGPGRVCLGASLNLDPERKADMTPEAIRNGAFAAWHSSRDESRLLRFHAKSFAYALCHRAGFRLRSRPSLRSGNFAIHKTDIEAVNGFDEAFVGWGQEDDNLGRRLYMAGVVPVALCRQARITHIPHPRRNAGRADGANIERHRAPIAHSRAAQGLDCRPYSDVITRRPGLGTT